MPVHKIGILTKCITMCFVLLQNMDLLYIVVSYLHEMRMKHERWKKNLSKKKHAG